MALQHKHVGELFWSYNCENFWHSIFLYASFESFSPVLYWSLCKRVGDNLA